MADAVIRLDRSKPFSECRGERTPDDPHYRVHFWQGQKVGKDMVLLPFDSQDILVPDDGKTEPWDSRDTEGKPVKHFPLYSPAMRDLLERKKKRQAVIAAAPEEDKDELDLDNPEEAATEVNFVAWLHGEVKYEWPLLQVAGKQRFSRVWQSKRQIIEDLVLDEKLVTEDQLAPEFAKLLPAKAAA